MPADQDLSRRLCSAAERGDLALVRELLQAGAAPNAVNPLSGSTPLTCAASRGRVEVAVALLEAGAHAYVKDRRDRYPLALAARSGERVLVELLLD